MAPDSKSRWAEIKNIFGMALSLEAAERESFLQEQCGNDEELRREVDSLLFASDATDDFLEKPVLSLASFAVPEPGRPPSSEPPCSPVDEQSPEPKAGSRIGAYRLEREVGRGGMGEVYLATRADSEFVKQVAIKLIRCGNENEQAIRRFRNERQILARIEHPYVARLIDGGSTPAGLPYFVMEYVEGQPINAFCNEHALSDRDRLELFLKVCSAVQYAHERDILHRDLKPSNILVKANGTPKLLDFGIAKIVGADLPGTTNEATIAGFQVLTPAYASPEQMRGDPATAGSDVYSLGVVLYELLCGERPSLSTLERVKTASATLGEARLSSSLRSIVLHAIRLDPQERYPTVQAFAADIRRYLEGLPPAASEATMEGTTPVLVSVAILPFRVLQSQQNSGAFLASGITDALITRLSRVDRLSVRPTSAVLKYTDASAASRAAHELRVRYVLEGSIHADGEHIRVNVQLVFAEAGVTIWAATFDENGSGLLKLEDSISEQVAHALIPQLTGEERAQLSGAGTASAKAHEAYLRGRWHWSRSVDNPDELAKALFCFMQAVAEDPNYARAHAGIADYYLRLGVWGGLPPGESFAASIEAAQTALRLDPTLVEAHASLGFSLWAYHLDYAAAEEHFNLAVTRNPDYASAHYWFGLLNSARRRPELAIANLERAARIDPNSPLILAALAFVHYNARQYRRALEILCQAPSELRNSGVVQEILAWCYLKTDEPAKAVTAARNARQQGNWNSPMLSVLAMAETAQGNRDAGIAARKELESVAQERYVSGYDRATAALATGDPSGALRHLKQALEERDWWVCWTAVDPRWDPLRSDPRFATLVATAQPLQSSGSAIPSVQQRPQHLSSRTRAALIGAVAAMLLGSFVWWRAANRPVPFSSVRFTKLTMNGTADSAAISPGGQHVAYTVLNGGKLSLWLRDLKHSAAVEINPNLTGEVRGLGFTSNGREISYLNYSNKEPTKRFLYLLPVTGGQPRQIPTVFPGPVGISQDGKMIASVRMNPADSTSELWIRDARSGIERRLAAYPYPERFTWTCMPAWSPDGKLIAGAIETTDRQGFSIRLIVFDAQTGKKHAVASPRWQWVQNIAWSGKNSALAVVGQEHDSSFQQIWYIPYGRGKSRRIGNGLDDYWGVSLTERGSEIVSVQQQTLSDIYLLRPHDLDHPVQITPGTGRYFDLAWMPDGRIIYASDATGSADLWVMNADGTGQHQITDGTGRSYAPVPSPEGKTIAFHSNRSGNWHIWRIGVDGSNPRQLTASLRDGNWPQFTPDGKFIVFHQTDLKGSFNLWKVPVSGGPALRLTSALTMHPAISQTSAKIASWYSDTPDNPHWKLAIFGPNGGEPLRVFDPSVVVKPDTLLRWTPDGGAITFLGYRGGVSNIWVQPVDGSSAHPLTSFSTGEIYSFDWARDNTLVYSRGLTTADVVLIKDQDRVR